MKKILCGALVSLSCLASTVGAQDRGFYTSLTSATNESSGNITDIFSGTLALPDAEETNSYAGVHVTGSGYIYFQGRHNGQNFSCYVHNSVVPDMTYYRTIAAAFNNGSRIFVSKFRDRDTCNYVSMTKTSWQHLNE